LVEDEEDRHYLKNNMDATRLFDEYKNKARDMSTRNLLKLETNIHELLALTNILLLSPKQSSAWLLDVFSEQSINTIYETLLNQIKANTKDLEDSVCMKIARIVNSVESRKLKKCDGELDLLTMARNMNYHEARVVRRINNA
jgi:hypothetical protein